MSYSHSSGTVTFAITLPVGGTVHDFASAILAAMSERSCAGDNVSANILSNLLSHLRLPPTSIVVERF